MASELADQVIEREVCAAVEHGITEAVIGHMTKRRRPRRVPDFDAYYRFLAPYEGRFKRAFRGYWDDQRKTVISNMKRTPPASVERGVSRPGASVKGLTFSELFEQWMFAKGPANKGLQVVYKDLAFKLAVQSALRQAKLYDISTNWDVFNPNIEKWLKGYSIDLADEVNTVTLDKLKGSLFEGWEAGEGVPDLLNRVRDLYEEFDRSRAEMVARTEALRASNEGALETYRASGVVDRTMWVVGPDPCEDCQKLDGAIAQLEGGTYSAGGETVDCPPLHPRCVCAIVPILEGEEL